VRPLTVTGPLSDSAHAYGVRLNVHAGIAGGGAIGAFVGMSAATALPQTPSTIAIETAALCEKENRMPTSLGIAGTMWCAAATLTRRSVVPHCNRLGHWRWPAGRQA